jgi:hypothetical protein
MEDEFISKPRTAEELYQKYQELYPEQFCINPNSSPEGEHPNNTVNYERKKMTKEIISKPGNKEELYKKYQELSPEQLLIDHYSVKLINPPLRGTSLLDPRFFPKTLLRGSYSRSAGVHQRRQEPYPHHKKTELR